MIHIATIHWKTSKWIDIQLKYLEESIKSEYRVYAFLNDIPEEHFHKFYYHSTEPIEDHAIKLNLLAEIISLQGKDDDILIFLDGDAFPISDSLESFIKSKIDSHKLLAIQRLECLQDSQPHPSFCATTIGFWKSLKGDWKAGHLWRDETGLLVSDVGGNLLLQLNKFNVNWLPLLRTNKRNIHALRFGIYENLIYHHGAGFRISYSRVDRVQGGLRINLIYKLMLFIKRVLAVVEIFYTKSNRKVIKNNAIIENEFYQKIKSNFQFYQELI